MATASKKPQAVPPDDRRPSTERGLVATVLRGFDAVYHFLASLKLAVITLGLLAAVLSYATFFESKYGGRAAQEWIYQSKGFAILLAFLAANILCAALIRFPWKRRQTGFVITHAGLLTLIAGSYYAKVTADEGQFAALEGETKGEIVRTDHPVIRVQKVDPHSGAVDREWELPFRPGSFAWGPGVPISTGFVASALGLGDRNPREVLTRPDDPFQFVVKSHIPASVPGHRHEAVPGGMPMARIRAWVKPPNAPQTLDVFPDEEDRWFTFSSRLYRTVRGRGPAQVAFAYVDRPEMVDDFLDPPADAGQDGVARFRYKDKAGKPRTHDLPLDGASKEAVALPESDVTVKFLGVLPFEAESAGLGRSYGEPVIPMAEFEVAKPGVAPAKYFAMASLPMVPNRVPSREGPSEDPPLLTLSYYLPPALDAAAGRFGLIEILGANDGSLYYRAYGRPDAGTKARSKLRGKGKIESGKEVTAFGGEGVGMRVTFDVEDYFTSGVEKEVCEPVTLPKSQIGNGIAASEVAMTVKDGSDEVTKDFFIRRSESFDPIWKTVTFPGGTYRVAYDVDRRPLGFDLKLVDFQREFDPGSEQAARFRSIVRLTDKAAGLNEKPITISMNEPLTHKGFTFYQSSYIRERDPQNPRVETGRVISVLQVGLNPGRTVMYLGCLLVVLGAFAQFYMRAGVFTDGGRRERAKADAKASANGHAGPPEPSPVRARRGDDEDTL